MIMRSAVCLMAGIVCLSFCYFAGTLVGLSFFSFPIYFTLKPNQRWSYLFLTKIFRKIKFWGLSFSSKEQTPGSGYCRSSPYEHNVDIERCLACFKSEQNTIILVDGITYYLFRDGLN